MDGRNLYYIMTNSSLSGFQGDVGYDADGNFLYGSIGVQIYDSNGNANTIGWQNKTAGGSMTYYPFTTDIKWINGSTSLPTGSICTRSCGHGICGSPFNCHCDNGWTRNQSLWSSDANSAPDCTSPICTDSCGVHGTCVGPDTCSCDEHWSGATCTVLTLPIKQYQLVSSQAGSIVLFSINAILLLLTIASTAILVIYRGDRLYRKNGTDMLILMNIGLVVGHGGILASTFGPNNITCAFRLFLTVG